MFEPNTLLTHATARHGDHLREVDAAAWRVRHHQHDAPRRGQARRTAVSSLRRGLAGLMDGKALSSGSEAAS